MKALAVFPGERGLRDIDRPEPAIAQAVMPFFAFRDDRKHRARAIAMMRHGFGGHRYEADEAVVRERREGRVGGFSREEKP